MPFELGATIPLVHRIPRLMDDPSLLCAIGCCQALTRKRMIRERGSARTTKYQTGTEGGLKIIRYAWLGMLTLLTATAGLTTYAADSTSADAQTISKIEQEWNEAVKTKNKAFFEKYLSGDFMYISENGVFSNGRTAFIDIIMKMPKVVEVTYSDEKITVHGTTGVAMGQWTVKDSTGSKSTRYTDVYAKGTDGWKGSRFTGNEHEVGQD